MLCCKKKEPPKKVQVMALKACCEGANIERLNERWEQFDDSLRHSVMTTKDAEGSLPYQLAASKGQYRVLEWLLDHCKAIDIEVDINKRDSKGRTPLLSCCENMVAFDSSTEAQTSTLFQCVKVLHRWGADLDVEAEYVKMTPLHWAAYHDAHETVAYLLSNGARFGQDLGRSSAIDLAGMKGHARTMQEFYKFFET